MKNLIISLSILFISCSTKEADKNTDNVNNRVSTEWIEDSGLCHGVAILKIDGCEYIFKKSGYSGGAAHKGDCDNPIHYK